MPSPASAVSGVSDCCNCRWVRCVCVCLCVCARVCVLCLWWGALGQVYELPEADRPDREALAQGVCVCVCVL